MWLHFKPKYAWKGWEREKIKIIIPFRAYPTRNRKFQKNNIKIKKYHYEFISSKNRLVIYEKERNKNYRSVPFRSVPTRCVIENSKQIAKKFKKLKNTVVASFQAKIGRKRLRKRENKNYPSVPFLPEAWKKIPKKW